MATPQQPQQSSPAVPNQPVTNTTAPSPPFDYQALLQHISHDVETALKARFDAALANLQKSIDNFDQRVNQKLQTHLATIQVSQADKATQDNHTQQLEWMTKTLDLLIHDLHILLDSRLYPMLMNGVGQA